MKLLKEVNTEEEALEFILKYKEKLDSGDIAFEQISLENKDRIGEKAKPIISKEVISTMAKKENLCEKTDPIIGDDQNLDRVKKSTLIAPREARMLLEAIKVDPNSISMDEFIIGYKEEQEHLDLVRDLKKEMTEDEKTSIAKIVMAHLLSNKNYYSKLQGIGLLEKAIEIKAPEEVKTKKKVIFLAGSIDMGEVEDWQSKVKEALKDYDVVLANPRRESWDSSWKQEIENSKFKEQVIWELENQEDADIIALYFDKDSKSPISLLELGLFGKIKDKMIVCVPEGFYRKGNVDIVCERYGIKKVETFEDFIKAIKDKISDKLEKASTTPGSFSTESQTPAELGNQESKPVKVNSVKENNLKTPVKINADNYFEKELLRKTINNWYQNVEKSTDPDDSLVTLRKELMNLELKNNISTQEVFKSISDIIRKNYSEETGNLLFKQKKEIDLSLNKLR